MISQQQGKNSILEGSIVRPLMMFFFPIWIGTFFQQFYTTVDAMIVGKYVGTSALAAVGASGSIVQLLVGFFTGLCSGAAVIISHHYGAGNREAISKGLHTAVVLATLGGIFITVVGILLTPWSLGIMKTPDDIFDESVLYMKVYYLGMVALLLYNMGTAILRAIGDSVRPVIFLIVSAFVNIGLDLLFIPVFHMGVAGAALATVLSEVVACIMTLYCLVTARDCPWQLHLSRLGADPTELKGICRIGLPTGAQSVLYTLSNMFIQAAINSFGTATIAAWTVYGRVDFIYWMTVSAMGLSVTTFVGQNFGAKKYDRMRKGTIAGLWLLTLLTVLIIALLLIFARPLLSLFSDDAEVIRITLQMVFFMVPTYLTYVCVEIFSGAIRGAGDVVAPTLMTCFGICVLRVIWLFTAVRMHHTVVMVQWCYPITWTVTSLMYLFYYFKTPWLEKRIAVQAQKG